MTDEEHFYRCGWSDALAAAREAVAAALQPCIVQGLVEINAQRSCLFAIDALRLKP